MHGTEIVSTLVSSVTTPSSSTFCISSTLSPTLIIALIKSPLSFVSVTICGIKSSREFAPLNFLAVASRFLFSAANFFLLDFFCSSLILHCSIDCLFPSPKESMPCNFLLHYFPYLVSTLKGNPLLVNHFLFSFDPIFALLSILF